MSAGDHQVERAADKLQETANRLSGQGGVKEKLADSFADDAAFVRKLKPSLMKARLRGKAPTDGRPAEGVHAPSGPQVGTQPKPNPPREGGDGPNPFVVVAVAFAVGVAIAKLIDWRGHAHPR
jgi:hypothetical protein